MKSTGIVRGLDGMGRVSIPSELRKIFDMTSGELVEIYLVNRKVILKKYQPGCVLCNGFDNITEYNGKKICEKCISDLQKQPH